MTQLWAIVLVALLTYLTYLVFAPFIAPLAWAMVLATIFYKANAWMLERVKRPNAAALITTLIITFLIVGPALSIGGVFVQQAIQFGTEIQADYAAGKYPVEKILEWGPFPKLLEWVAARGITTEELAQDARDGMRDVARYIGAQAGKVAANVAIFVFQLFVTLFATFYLLRDGDKLLDRIRSVLPVSEGQREGLIAMAYNVLYASVFSSIVVAAIQGLMGGILFWALGVSKPLLWGVVMGFLSLLPMLGSWLVWAPVAVAFVLSGDYVRAIILVAVGAGIIGMVDNFLRPMLISGRVELNGLLVFISVLGGIAAFGMIGLLLGPILVALGQAMLIFYADLREEEAAKTAAAS